MDLAATDDNFIGVNNCVSATRRVIYQIPFDSQYRNMLTNLRGQGQYEDSFTIDEIEVW
jgi:hypothetical protein